MAARVESAVNIDDLRKAAKRVLPGFLFDFIEGGVDDETGLSRNEQAFARHRLLPRYLGDVSRRSLQTEVLGVRFDCPFGIAPTGPAPLFRPHADLILAEAAMAADIPFILSGASGDAIETVARRAPGHVWSQLYGARDRAISREQIARAHAAGVEVLVVTVDTPVTPRRERHLRNGISVPFRLRPHLLPRMAVEVLRHPAWFARYLLGGGMPRLENWARHCPSDASAAQVAAFFFSQAFEWRDQPSQTWRDIENWLRLWPGKLVLKGHLHCDDAVRAVDAGADGIIVSNHGGKALDRAPASIDVLPGIVAAVGSRTAIMLDSGVRRGADIVTALCLGACFVFAGRATLYGVAAGGSKGARKAIELLRTETDLVMAGIGCTRTGALGAQYVMDADRASTADGFACKENTA
jgi:L-lactate dehydrogenase (cytochrome)/(S)-mandelate dehydrogenase